MHEKVYSQLNMGREKDANREVCSKITVLLFIPSCSKHFIIFKQVMEDGI